ncbi:hypothetical protein [Levilactobacillus spicheri]|uniref:Uncharacterized protein n=2 Tax=Levilactobacillus spicheri TaxID=216463 RepID=A0A0F3RT60_9LACO|nr:hypothetical protein [Levilactobacillus spicheri]KJW13181.1 hypothetical protein VC81_04040 [Levilactobacillus spicheri]KRL47532.1 hypothetical protein FD37_GL002402 [Levilactobacillus spicheri DSM 15429]GEO68057.1 hypothetical protein LSP04_24760 [Levilactobacillus spicheri]
MTENLLLNTQDSRELLQHLDEWQRWRQYQDPMTADMHWDRFIEKSREKAAWQAGLATEIDHWESLQAIHRALQDQLVGAAHGGQTPQ